MAKIRGVKIHVVPLAHVMSPRAMSSAFPELPIVLPETEETSYFRQCFLNAPSGTDIAVIARFGKESRWLKEGGEVVCIRVDVDGGALVGTRVIERKEFAKGKVFLVTKFRYKQGGVVWEAPVSFASRVEKRIGRLRSTENTSDAGAIIVTVMQGILLPRNNDVGIPHSFVSAYRSRTLEKDGITLYGCPDRQNAETVYDPTRADRFQKDVYSLPMSFVFHYRAANTLLLDEEEGGNWYSSAPLIETIEESEPKTRRRQLVHLPSPEPYLVSPAEMFRCRQRTKVARGLPSPPASPVQTHLEIEFSTLGHYEAFVISDNIRSRVDNSQPSGRFSAQSLSKEPITGKPSRTRSTDRPIKKRKRLTVTWIDENPICDHEQLLTLEQRAEKKRREVEGDGSDNEEQTMQGDVQNIKREKALENDPLIQVAVAFATTHLNGRVHIDLTEVDGQHEVNFRF